MKQTILVTGGFGFIGINLVLRLLETTSYSVIIVSRRKGKKIPERILKSKRVTVKVTNLLDRSSVEDLVKKCTIVVHLAGSTVPPKSGVEATSMMSDGVNGVINILESAKKSKTKKIIVLSSGGVYGSKKNGSAMEETDPANPLNPYTKTKLAIDTICSSFFASFGTPVVILRPFNVYGPFQAANKVIPIFITELLLQHQVVLNHGGKQKRDFIYIDDLVDLIGTIIMSKDKSIFGEVFNVCSGKEVSIAELTDIIVQKLGRSKALIRKPEASAVEAMCNVGSPNKAINKFHWQPKVTLAEGIERTVQWYRNNKQYIK